MWLFGFFFRSFFAGGILFVLEQHEHFLNELISISLFDRKR